MEKFDAKIIVENAKDLQNFCEEISQIPEFQKLTSDQKLRIVCCYPIVTTTVVIGQNS